MEFKKGSGNVYEDLRFDDAEEMQAKAALVSKIDDEIRARKLTRQEAARRIGITKEQLDSLLIGHFHKEKQAEILQYLGNIGR